MFRKKNSNVKKLPFVINFILFIFINLFSFFYYFQRVMVFVSEQDRHLNEAGKIQAKMTGELKKQEK